MEAVEFALFTAEVIRCCHRHGVLWSVENPLSSKLWSFDPISKLHSLPGTADFFFDMCRYGSQFKKPTKILSNIAGLSKLSARCTRDHSHTAAQGTQKVFVDGISKHVRNTTLVGAYPAKLARGWAFLVSRALPPQSRIGSECFSRRFAADLEVALHGCHDGHAASAAARACHIRPPLSCFDASGKYVRPWADSETSPRCTEAEAYIKGNEVQFWHSRLGGRCWNKGS